MKLHKYLKQEFNAYGLLVGWILSDDDVSKLQKEIKRVEQTCKSLQEALKEREADLAIAHSDIPKVFKLGAQSVAELVADCIQQKRIEIESDELVDVNCKSYAIDRLYELYFEARLGKFLRGNSETDAEEEDGDA